MPTQYASISDLTDLSIEQDTLTNMGLTDDELDAALLSASVEADGYFRSRYSCPLSSYGQDVKQAVCDIAAFRAMTKKGYTAQGGDRTLSDGYARAVAWLRGVANGTITPDVTDSSTPSGVVAEIYSRDEQGWE